MALDGGSTQCTQASPIRRVEVKVGVIRDSNEILGHNRRVKEQILEFWMFVEKEASFVSAFSTNSLCAL